MNQINKQITSGIEVATGAGVDSRPVASPSRRRIIKLGAATVPVLATLTSQSALAGACVSTSAWGSTQGVQNGSHTHKKTEVVTGFTITAWNASAQGNGTPWAEYKAAYGNSPNPNAVTFADVYAAVGSTYMRNPSLLGFTSTNLVMGNLANDDKGYFLVAMLNYAVGQIPPTECVSAANWLAIVAGTYPAVTPWTVHEIRLYLENNFIVQA